MLINGVLMSQVSNMMMPTGGSIGAWIIKSTVESADIYK